MNILLELIKKIKNIICVRPLIQINLSLHLNVLVKSSENDPNLANILMKIISKSHVKVFIDK